MKVADPVFFDGAIEAFSDFMSTLVASSRRESLPDWELRAQQLTEVCAISGVAPEEPVFAPKTGLQPWRLQTGSGNEMRGFPEIGLEGALEKPGRSS